MRLRLLFVAALALVAPALFAEHYADFYVIPVAGHTPGANNTMWQSDVAIQNFSAVPLNVELAFIESGEGNMDNIVSVIAPSQSSSRVTVPAGGSVLLQDVVGSVRASGVVGAILIGADRPFAVTSRSYSMSPSGDTVGQTVPPARDFLENTIGTTVNSGAVAYVPGLISNARFRTNLGFVAGNTSLQKMIVDVMIKDGTGAVAGTRQFVISSGAFTHVQFSSRSVANRSFDIGGAEFRITEGSGAVVPYASVIDNATADAVFVSGQFPDNTPTERDSVSTATQSVFRQLFDRLPLY